MTTVKYTIPKQGRIILEIFDIQGRSIEKVIDAFHQAGEFSVPIDMRDFPSGIYFYRLQAGSFSEVWKMLLVR